MHVGLHASAFSLNAEMTLEPRLGVKWHLSQKRSLSLGSGLHSQIEPLGIYVIERERDGMRYRPNSRLRVSKSWHNVLAFEQRLADKTWFRTELYYDLGFDIPVSNLAGSAYSIINTYFLYNVISGPDKLSNAGTTTNYGIEATFEKLFSTGFYALATGSLFDARYTTKSTMRYPSRYNTRYMLNMLGGVELNTGRLHENILRVNVGIVFGGGNRYTPIDLDATEREDYVVTIPDKSYSAQLKPYFRVDIGVNYTINRSYRTHAFYLDAQNVIHHINPGFVFYDRRLNRLDIEDQLGILPILGYRLTF